MKLEEYKKAETIPTTVLFTKRITPEDMEEIREITLQVNKPDFHVEPGQSIGVVAPGSPEFGNSEHFRLYTIADIPAQSTPEVTVVTICVKRCDYIDEFSGEMCQGIGSNYLCDLSAGAALRINGPFGVPFTLPTDPAEDLILIGAGTGIAPFRAFMKKLYRTAGERTGKVLLFHGARTGLELLYMNEEDSDLTQYYDRETFEAFTALSPRPGFGDPIALDYALQTRADQLWELLQKPGTRMYVAGQQKLLHTLDRVFQARIGSEEEWTSFKQGLVQQGRWQEVVY